jgi:ribosome-associated protein
MADTLAASRDAALAIGRLLAGHNGGDVVVLDLAERASWTDFFVIATATSGAHLRGLARFVDEAVATLDLERFNKIKAADDEEWILADFGTVVVHLMTERARTFYELEKLWFEAVATRIEAPAAPIQTATP